MLRRLLSRRTIYTKCVFVSGVFLIPTFFSFVMGATAWQLLVMNFQALVPLVTLLFFLCLFSALFRTSHPLTEVVMGAYERLKWNLPGFQVVTRKFAWAKFGQAFGTLYRVGVPLSTAIALALKASGSRVLADVAPQITQDIEQGLPLSYAFRCTHRFPDMFLEMLTTGETTGEVDTMVQKAAQVLSEEAETRSVQLAHAAAELFFLFIAFLLFRGLLGL
jgi:type IV pilus assembly protein PilC